MYPVSKHPFLGSPSFASVNSMLNVCKYSWVWDSQLYGSVRNEILLSSTFRMSWNLGPVHLPSLPLNPTIFPTLQLGTCEGQKTSVVTLAPWLPSHLSVCSGVCPASKPVSVLLHWSCPLLSCPSLLLSASSSTGVHTVPVCGQSSLVLPCSTHPGIA